MTHLWSAKDYIVMVLGQIYSVWPWKGRVEENPHKENLKKPLCSNIANIQSHNMRKLEDTEVELGEWEKKITKTNKKTKQKQVNTRGALQ